MQTARAPRPARAASLLHELRTPLNHIIGYSEMLVEQAAAEGHQSFVPDLQKIRHAGQQLLSLLNRGGVAPADGGLVAGPLQTSAVSLPRPDSPLSAAALPSPAAGPQPLLLVVDDNPANRDVLSRRLNRQGYEVVTAENGRQAMHAVRTRAFDLVLLDIMMPEMDGYEVLEALKADESLRHLPVIMVSALDDLDSVVRCIDLGADDYLPKPFPPTLLKARISACLEKKRAHDREMVMFEQLQDQYRLLQELGKQRDDLMHMIVHDLRTPLASLITGMQTLGTDDLDEFQREMVGISIHGGETLLSMINDLLDVEKMEAGSMQLDYAELDAADLVASAASQVNSLCKDTRISLVTDIATGQPAFPGDESKLRRVLVNLLGNALKFTPAGGTVTVQVWPSKNGASLVFSVSDTGEGIPAEAFERIFEKFGQVESRQGGRTMSTGLGLAFCKLAVGAHGGQIGVRSVPGKGSTFHFTVPTASSQAVNGH